MIYSLWKIGSAARIARGRGLDGGAFIERGVGRYYVNAGGEDGGVWVCGESVGFKWENVAITQGVT